MLCLRSLLIVSSLLLGTTHADTLTGRVVGVADGDTITVLDANRQQHKIRLQGIDAPEKKQAYGERSKQSLAEMVFGKSVLVEWGKKDRYQRIIGKVLTSQRDCQKDSCPRTLDAGLVQIALGMAWHYKKYQNEQSPEDRSSYAQTEVHAQSKNIGLWADAEPVAPWNFRHKK